VRKRDLNVQWHGDDVGDEDECDSRWPIWESAPDEAVAEEEPVACHASYFGFADPACRAGGFGPEKEMVQGQDVEVEPGYAHDGVVCVLLVANSEVCCFVPDEGEVVIA